MSWRKVNLGELITESRVPSENPDPDRRITVRLNVLGVEKRPLENEKAGATKQFIRKTGQFIYGKQNFHKGAFGIIPIELNGFESSADLPSFDVREDCLPEWIFYFFKQGGFYLELAKIARGVATQRIHPEQIYNLEIPLPDIETQKSIIASIKAIEEKGKKLNKELTYQLNQLENLNQAILQEAVQGKLVPQDPNDEPASELLKRIKAALRQAQGSKKAKELPPIKPEEIPFEIPDNWVWCRLGEIANHSLGKMLDVNKNKGEFKPYLRNINVQWFTFDLSDLKHMKFLVDETDKYSAINGDILICEGGYPGRAAIWEEDYSIMFQKALHRVRFVNQSLNEKLFVYYLWLINGSDFFKSYLTGSGIQHFTGKKLNTLPIPLPPLAEQNRIVNKIEEFMQLCDELQYSIQQSKIENEKLLQGALRDALKKEESVETI